MHGGTALPSRFGLQSIGRGDLSDHEAGIGIVDAIPETKFSQGWVSYAITEDYIQALRDGKLIEIRVGSMGTNEYQVYLSLEKKD